MEQKNNEAAGGLTEWLTRDGAPWRPFTDEGLLVKPYKSAQLATTLVAACERPLLTHLKAVCQWPERQRNKSWRVGDFSFYVLSFEPAAGTQVYVQFWSEPDEDGVIFEVSSGAWNPPADAYVDAEKQELLRDHGFELGGNAENFRKVVAIEQSKDLRALAREAIAVLTKVLGYNGTQALRYELNLQSRSKIGHVLDEVSPELLMRLMREWGFVAELKWQKEQPPLIESRTDDGPFGVGLEAETEEGSGAYQAIKLRTYRKVDLDETHEAVNLLNWRMSGINTAIDPDGDLMFESVIVLFGGVTAEHLSARFAIWRAIIGEVDQVIG